MQLADIPNKFPVAFGANAVSGDIREVPLTSADPNAATLNGGFPPPTFLPVGAGGVPPDGRDFNGILNQATAWDRWFSAGGTVTFDETFAGQIGGYPEGALLRSAFMPGSFWISDADDNDTDPDDPADREDWSPWGFGTGDSKLSYQTVAAAGWVVPNDGTIGNASSNATLLADPLAEWLFALVWGTVNNTWAPLLTSAGAPVARGVDAATDWAANRQLTLPRELGRAQAASGAGAGLTSRLPGQWLGAESVALVEANNGPHSHSASVTDPTHTHQFQASVGAASSPGATFNGVTSTLTTAAAATGISVSIGSSGSGTAHENMQPTVFKIPHIKL